MTDRNNYQRRAVMTPTQLAALLGLPTGVCDEHKTARWICQHLDHDPRVELARLSSQVVIQAPLIGTQETNMQVGDRCYVARHKHGQVARVMAVAEGYAMLRYPRCAPFVEAVRDLIKTT